MYLLLLVLCLPLAAWSQSAQLATVHFSPNQGLPSSEVYDLLQDQKGFLWIATDNGVSRFNGYQFDNFGFGQGLSENVILSLVEDAAGNIWMASIGIVVAL
ncbi:MAG: two-component regulator propeller domain-containing protein, partial [Bacteroidota bacterium]